MMENPPHQATTKMLARFPLNPPNSLSSQAKHPFTSPSTPRPRICLPLSRNYYMNPPHLWPNLLVVPSASPTRQAHKAHSALSCQGWCRGCCKFKKHVQNTWSQPSKLEPNKQTNPKMPPNRGLATAHVASASLSATAKKGKGSAPGRLARLATPKKA